MISDEPRPLRILMANLPELLTQVVVGVAAQHGYMEIGGQGQVEVLFAAQHGVERVILNSPQRSAAPIAAQPTIC